MQLKPSLGIASPASAHVSGAGQRTNKPRIPARSRKVISIVAKRTAWLHTRASDSAAVENVNRSLGLSIAWVAQWVAVCVGGETDIDVLFGVTSLSISRRMQELLVRIGEWALGDTAGP